ncbi:MAG: peptide chain release factor 1 [Leptolyngbya sp. ERB_1_1]
MFDPLRRLKYLPWAELLQVALVTIGFTILIDWLFFQVVRLPALRPTVAQFFNSSLSFLIFLGAAVGIGALSVAIMERWFRQIVITNSSLWALIPCVALWLWLRSFLPESIFPQLLTPALSFESFMCIVLGVFWKGRPYWR